MADYTVLLALADRLAPRFKRAFLDAVATLDDTLSSREIADALLQGDVRALERVGAWQVFRDALAPGLRDAVLEAVASAGGIAISQMPKSVGVQLAFDRTNPKALEAVDTVVNDALTDIVGASQDGIRQVLRQGYTEGWTAQQIARRIRDNLGLAPRDANAVEHYRQGLLDNDVPPGRADELAGQYADRLLRQRASRIARTESIRAASAGQQGAWLDAKSQGLLDSDSRRFWLVTPDDRLCPLCEAVPDYNADGVALGEPFQTDAGPVMYPPAHPLCRCATTLQTRKVAYASVA